MLLLNTSFEIKTFYLITIILFLVEIAKTNLNDTGHSLVPFP